MEDVWREMFRNDKFAGGAVWHFHDQGILRKAKEPVNRKLPTDFVWKDSVTYYDTRGIDGTDGIVYSDRTPQVAGKVDPYPEPGNSCQRELCPSRHSCPELAIELPNDPDADIWYLELDFYNTSQEPLYRHTIELSTSEKHGRLKNEIYSNIPSKQLVEGKDQAGPVVDHHGFRYDFLNNDLSVMLSDKTKGNNRLVEGLYVRSGRAILISDKTVKNDVDLQYWEPYLLSAQNAVVLKNENKGNSYSFSGWADFPRGENYPQQKLAGNIDYTVDEKGMLTISYALKPENATGVLLEAGVSLILSQEITDFTWIGNGPYASYPDKYLLNSFGIFSMKKGDLNFNGNRSNVEVAVLTDAEGNGIAITGNRSNISVEVINNRIVVSHNALLMGMGNKKSRAVVKINADNAPEIKGTFNIIPLRANQWPKKLIEVPGTPDRSLRPFQPFYHSYGLTW